jgi:hypothetical protein
LTWSAPPGCGAAAPIRERVSELLGQRELDLRRVERVEGRVHQTRDGWALELRLFDAFGVRERELTSRYCDDLAEAAAVAITLAFEAASPPETAAAAAPQEPPVLDAPTTNAGAAEAATTAPSQPDAVAARPTSDGESSAPATRLALGAEGIVDKSALPSLAAGASLIGQLRWTELRLGVFAVWLPSVEQSVGPSQRVDFSLLIAGVRACYDLGHGLIDTALCAGLEAGQLAARGSGLAQARSARDPWLAPELGLELSCELSSRISLQAHVEAVAPLLKQGYAINDTDSVHHVSSLGVRSGAGFLFGF